MLTTFANDQYVYDSLRAGASAFLLKDAPPEELLAAIAVVARGDALLAPVVTRSVVEAFVRGSPARPGLAGPLEKLTTLKGEVLQLLAGGRSNAEIATDLVVSEATVKTNVDHVLMKPSVRDRGPGRNLRLRSRPRKRRRVSSRRPRPRRTLHEFRHVAARRARARAGRGADRRGLRPRGARLPRRLRAHQADLAMTREER
jgi:DNA-binding NarL/FixJ family response regulator